MQGLRERSLNLQGCHFRHCLIQELWV